MVAIMLGHIAVAAEVAANAKGMHGHAKMGNPAAAELGATAVFDPNGTLWTAHKAAGAVAVSQSRDFGKTWSNAVLVTPGPESTDSGADARPKIAVGRRGEIYVSWTKPLTKPYTGEIKFSRSLDGGRTFSTPMVVHRDRQEITHRFDSLTVNAEGRVIVAWIDKRDLVAAVAAKSQPYRGAAIYFAVSDDRGATFRGDFKLADHSCECCRISLISHADGSLSAMWRHIFAPNIRDHALARFTADGKAEPVRRVSFDDWRIDACPHHGPSVAEDAKHRLHAVWFNGAPPQQGVFYGRLSEGGVQARRRIGEAAAAHADIAVSGESLAIAWKEFDGERTRLRGMRSNDGGEQWQEVDLASTSGPSDHPRVLLSGERFYVFWNTRDQPLSVTAFPK